MVSGIFNLLRKYSDDTFKVNSIIISAYLRVNGIDEVLNEEIQRHKILDGSDESKILEEFIGQLSDGELDFEGLIELFEFVISPSDKVMNGAIYTPKSIREYIVNQALERSNVLLDQILIADISCGCGGFLLTAAKKVKSITNRSFFDIFRDNIFGVDITGYSIERAKLLLSLLAIGSGEDQSFYIFNLYVENSLNFDWREHVSLVNQNGGFDLVVGNPPYVASRNMDAETLNLSQNFVVARTGHPDLYIPFFQIGFEMLNETGILGYITVNTFIKSINGRALRQYFNDQSINLELINFGGEQVFKDRNTYTCICFLSNGNSNGLIRYRRCWSRELLNLENRDFTIYDYQDLNHFDGWNLTNSRVIDNFVSVVEQTGRQFKELYTTKNGIATLKNSIYKFVPVREDENYYFLGKENEIFPIERRICRNIVNANKLKNSDDLADKIEKIIFPYFVQDGRVIIITEEVLRREFPLTYRYLFVHRAILANRDKGRGEYEAWYAYGRRQSLDINQLKLFFPHICERPRFVISQDTDLLFYNGIAVTSNDLEELILLKKLMETDLFYYYIRATTKDYSSGYISMSKNYLKNFGIYNFTDEERREFLLTATPNQFILEKYGLEIPNL